MDNKEFLKQMGAKIKAARKEKGLYVRDLGKLCNLDYANISRMENGQVDARIITLKRIAEALGIDVNRLLR